MPRVIVFLAAAFFVFPVLTSASPDQFPLTRSESTSVWEQDEFSGFNRWIRPGKPQPKQDTTTTPVSYTSHAPQYRVDRKGIVIHAQANQPQIVLGSDNNYYHTVAINGLHFRIRRFLQSRSWQDDFQIKEYNPETDRFEIHDRFKVKELVSATSVTIDSPRHRVTIAAYTMPCTCEEVKYRQFKFTIASLQDPATPPVSFVVSSERINYFENNRFLLPLAGPQLGVLSVSAFPGSAGKWHVPYYGVSLDEAVRQNIHQPAAAKNHHGKAAEPKVIACCPGDPYSSVTCKECGVTFPK